MTMGAREAPLETVPVQLVNVRLLRATAPVSGVVWEYQYWSMSVRGLVRCGYADTCCCLEVEKEGEGRGGHTETVG